jgi:hypothetical protein
VSLSVVKCSKSAGEQGVLCTVITRMLLDHIRIIVHMDISFIILLYTSVSFCALCLGYCVCNCVVYCFECVCVILCFLCFCLLCIVLYSVVPLPPGTYPLAINNNNIWRPFLHAQPEDAPCCGDRDPLRTVIGVQMFFL